MSRRKLKEKKSQFPYKEITNIDQCVKAFEFIAFEIEKIQKEMVRGVDAIFWSNILREAIKYDEYKKVSKNIEEHSLKITRIISLINDYLSNGVISDYPNKGINITSCVRYVDISTDIVEGLVKGYNERKEFVMPSIKGWYDIYSTDIKLFSKTIERWEKRFGININKARLPVYCEEPEDTHGSR